MYIGIDVGGTKTLVGRFSDTGKLEHSFKFPTPKLYADFLEELDNIVEEFSTNNLLGVAIAIPGTTDQEAGTGIAFGNLDWHNVPIRTDLQRIFGCPVAFDNDANIAGLAEALALRRSAEKVLYVTVSTGIGTGIVTHQRINRDFANSEGGHMLLEHEGKLQYWESFASGRAIVKRFGARTEDIQDESTWKVIADNLAKGLINLCAILQPDTIVIGGGVGAHFEHFDKYLTNAMEQLNTAPLVPVPPIVKARHPEEAVLYGCYELAKECHASSTSTTTA